MKQLNLLRWVTPAKFYVGERAREAEGHHGHRCLILHSGTESWSHDTMIYGLMSLRFFRSNTIKLVSIERRGNEGGGSSGCRREFERKKK